MGCGFRAGARGSGRDVDGGAARLARAAYRPPGTGRNSGGALLMRGIEFGAAGLVLLLGVGLLAGYIAAERVTCF